MEKAASTDTPPTPAGDRYGANKGWWVFGVYAIAILIWVVIVLYFRMYVAPGGWVLLLPIFVFFIAIIYSSELCQLVETEMFKANHLSVGLVFALTLLIWMGKDYTGDVRMFSATIIIAMVMTLLALIDVWVPREWLYVNKHVRSALQTMSITLFIFGLITYFLTRSGAALLRRSD